MTNTGKSQKIIEKDSVKKQKPTIFMRFIVTLILMLGVFTLAAVITYIATVSATKQTRISTYEDCISARGSVIQESYPAVCITYNGEKFIQPLSEEEQKLLDSPLNQNNNGNFEGKFCGGIAGVACPEGYACNLDGDYPDSGGKCTKN